MSSLGIFFVATFLFLSAIILFSAWRSPIPRKIGFRNIRRRIGNTIMVVIGSLVGAALISGSLVLSDSLDKSFQVLVEENLGEGDLIITTAAKQQQNTPFPYMTNAEYQQIETSLKKDPKKVDGVMGVHFFQTAPEKLDANGNPDLNIYNIDTYALDFAQYNKFGQNPIKIPAPSAPNSVYISDTLATKLNLKQGDTMRIPFAGKDFDLKVEKIYDVKDFPSNPYIIFDINSFNKAAGFPEGAYSSVFVSAKGGIEPDNYDGTKFEEYVKKQLEGFNSDNVKLNYYEAKSQGLNGFGFKSFSYAFLVMSMFGIFAGILLIANLYSMLAAERKYEMGILRAIALTRWQLTKTFIYEGYLYSVISSFFGSLLGLGVGYFLVYSISHSFGKILDLMDMQDVLRFTFDAKPDSLLIAFSVGSIITILTAIFASYKISKLNIVSAIRDSVEVTKQKINVKWLVTTILLALMTMCFFSNLFIFFSIRQSFDTMREQGDNQIADLSPAKYEETVNVIQAYTLYVGVVFTLIFGTFLFNRLFKLVTKKDISRLTITLSSGFIIAFTALLSKFDSFLKAGQSNSSVALFFISGVAIVIAMSLIITYNIDAIVGAATFLFRPFRSLTAVMKISLRYPAINRSRTGLTLVMFALVIFLIVYTSMMKVTVRQINNKTVDESLGGYDVIVVPSFDADYQELLDINKISQNSTDVEKTRQMIHTTVILPEYKYKDLEDSPVYDNPLMYQHEKEDYFRTYLDGIPADFIKEKNIKLSGHVDGYADDKAVWDAVINDPSKVILGTAFKEIGYGPRPDIKLGQKIKVADLYNAKSYEKEVIGFAELQNSGMGVNANFYPWIITTDQAIESQFSTEYISHASNSEILVKFRDGVNVQDSTKVLKHNLINNSIAQIYELKELTDVAQSFVDSLILMFQAFMGFSLIVGVSGLAIIVTRSVQERRQQIGMLRSLGLQRSMVLASFLIEATFITFLGIVIGISMGTIGALNEFYVAYHDQDGIKPVFAYKEVFIISLMVYLAALLFSILPSIKAAMLSPVEATNYPE